MIFPPKIMTAKLDMRDYHPAYEAEFTVWCNPPDAFVERWHEMHSGARKLATEMLDISPKKTQKEYLVLLVDAKKNNPISYGEWDTAVNDIANSMLPKKMEWVSELLSQGEPDTHISAVQLTQLKEEYQETDPRLFIWIVQHSMDKIQEHRLATKKV
jgi:hypothetical protein